MILNFKISRAPRLQNISLLVDLGKIHWYTLSFVGLLALYDLAQAE